MSSPRPPVLSPDRVRLAWSTEYTIERATLSRSANGGEYVAIATLLSTRDSLGYDDYGVRPTERYTYQLHDGAAVFSTVSVRVPPAMARPFEVQIDDVIRITWQLTGWIDQAVVYRKLEGEDWHAIGQVLPAGGFLATFEDPIVREGEIVRYRLGVTGFEGIVTTGEVAVAVSPPVAFTMSPVTLDAGARRLRVTVSAPRRGSGTVGLFDVGGRSLGITHVDLGRGTNQLEVAADGLGRTGVYFLRVGFGGETRVRKLSLRF